MKPSKQFASLLFAFAVLLPCSNGAAIEWPGKEDEEIQRLRSSRARTRLEALRNLSRLPPARFHPLLLKMLEDKSITVRQEAASIAGAKKVMAALPVFKNWLSHWDPRRRKLGAEALARLGSREGIKALVRILDDPDQRVRQSWFWA